MIMTSGDINEIQIGRLGRMLMHRSDDLSDNLWEEYGCDPDAVLSHPTLMLEMGIDRAESCNTFSVQLVDRTSQQSLDDAGFDKSSSWWIPIDDYVGRDATCTLAEVVDFLGSDTYDTILKNPLMLYTMAVDMLNRYPEPSASEA
jgi:hypothetical protein